MSENPGSSPQRALIVRGRLCVIAAALLWSTGSAFAKVLTRETPLGLHSPTLDPMQIASLRVLFAGLVLLPLLRRRDFSFRPMMVATAICFALLNVSFMTAMMKGTAANAVLLQYTAPLWLYLAGIWFLGEQADRRAGLSVAIGLVGIATIVYGGWQDAQVDTVLTALASGILFASVMLCLRRLHDTSSLLVTTINLLFAGLVLLPFALRQAMPSAAQLSVLVVYGAFQMALPYWLMARGLRSVSPQEASTLTLLEPLLSPLWAYLASPATETPTVYTLAGGVFILGALAYRYWPRRSAVGEPATGVVQPDMGS